MKKFLCLAFVFGTLLVGGQCDSYSPTLRKICRLTGQDLNAYVNGKAKPDYTLSPVHPTPTRTSYVPVKTMFVAPPSTAGSASADTSSYGAAQPYYAKPAAPSYEHTTPAPSYSAFPQYYAGNDITDTSSYTVSSPYYNSAPAVPAYEQAQPAAYYKSAPAAPAYEEAPPAAYYKSAPFAPAYEQAQPAVAYDVAPVHYTNENVGATVPYYGQTSYASAYNGATTAYTAPSVALNHLSVSSFVIPGDNSYKTYTLPPTYSTETLPIQKDGTVATLYVPNETPAAPSAPAYPAVTPCQTSSHYATAPAYPVASSSY